LIKFLNTIVCHHQKGGDCWNKMCLTIKLCVIIKKSFDDNKVLKKLTIGSANVCSSVQDHR